MGLIIRDSGRWWPNGVVPFRIKRGDFTAAQEATIRQGIAIWEQGGTLVRFVPKTDDDNESDFVTFQKHNKACQSSVGKQGGEQATRCDLSSGSFTAGSIAHEIGHTLGFFHEHQRPERDAVVAVAQSAIQNEPQNFKRIDDELSVGAYDCQSIMHYPKIFAKITNIDPVCAEMGNRTDISTGDITTVIEMLGRWRFRAAGISAVHPRTEEGAVSLYVIGRHGGVWWSFWPDGNTTKWSPWFQIGNKTFPQGSQISALHPRTEEGAVSLYVVDSDGGVWSSFWPDRNTTQWSPWLAIPGDNIFPPGSQVSALHPRTEEGAVSLYVIGRHGGVWGSFWPDGNTTQWSPWFRIGEDKTFPVYMRAHS
jgi:hypothetical protein